VYDVLLHLGLADPDAGTVDDPTCCPGADTCNLAVTHSRRLAKRLGDALPQLKSQKTRGLTVKISGCPNSCGQHHIASIGFHGSTARAANQVIPVYQLHLGGGVDAAGVVFGRVLDKIPVHRVNEAVKRLMQAYEREGADGEAALAFFRKLPPQRVTEILGDTVAGTLNEARMEESDRQDIGTGLPFRVMTGKGECAS
jgi:sulfite reductase beta subunit-like hemoprotein